MDDAVILSTAFKFRQTKCEYAENEWLSGWVHKVNGKRSKSKQYNSHSFSNTVAKPVNLVNSRGKNVRTNKRKRMRAMCRKQTGQKRKRGREMMRS